VVTVSPALVERHVGRSGLLRRAWQVLRSDAEVEEYLRMANVNAVERLLYNDHGPVHAQVVAGSALEIYEILRRHGLRASSIVHRVVENEDQARLIILLAAYLHDIGNAVHRANHEMIGAILAAPILSRLLPQIIGYEKERVAYRIRSEVMHAIYATSMNVDALTLEASIVKVADATDMAEGRARLPYNRGKADIHALSALSIRKVEIVEGDERPVRIIVYMTDLAGVFQIEKVLLPKIVTSLIREFIEIVPIVEGDGKRLKPILP